MAFGPPEILAMRASKPAVRSGESPRAAANAVTYGLWARRRGSILGPAAASRSRQLGPRECAMGRRHDGNKSRVIRAGSVTFLPASLAPLRVLD